MHAPELPDACGVQPGDAGVGCGDSKNTKKGE
jgi:hypothetical protein